MHYDKSTQTGRLWRRLLGLALLGAVLYPSAHLAWEVREGSHLGLRWDDSIYWVCAKSLAEGRGYRILSLPEEPYQTKYPPLFPWLLSLAWRIQPEFPQNLPWAMLLVWWMLPLNVLLASRLFRELGICTGAAWALCALLALNPYVVLYSVSLMSELMFANLALACLLLVMASVRGGAAAWWAGMAGLVGGAAYLTRGSGIVLLGLAAIYWLRWERRRAVWFCAGMLPAVVGWTLWGIAHQTPSRDLNLLYYTDYVRFHLLSFSWRDVPMVAWRNLSGIYAAVGGVQLFGISTQGWGMGLRLLVATATVMGSTRLLRRVGMFPVGWFVLGHLGLLASFHVLAGDPHERHLLPLLAPAGAGLWVGVRGALRQVVCWLRSSRAEHVALGGLVSAGLVCVLGTVLLANFWVLYQMENNLGRARARREEFQRVSMWIRQNTPPESKVLCPFCDQLVYLYAGRKAQSIFVPARLHYYNDREGTFQMVDSTVSFMRRYGLEYLVLVSPKPTAFHLTDVAVQRLWAVAEHSRELQVLARVGRTRVYGLKESSAAPPRVAGSDHWSSPW